MTAAEQIKLLISEHGREVTVADDSGSRSFKAFVQPFLYKNRSYLNAEYRREGYFEPGHCLYIGPAGEDLSGAARSGYITAAGVKYAVVRKDVVYFDSEPCYCRAILEKEAGV